MGFKFFSHIKNITVIESILMECDSGLISMLCDGEDVALGPLTCHVNDVYDDESVGVRRRPLSV